MTTTSFPRRAIEGQRPASACTAAAPTPLRVKGIETALAPVTDIAALEPLWRDLAGRADHSFFLSWPWIGTWLRHLPKRAEPHLLTARDRDDRVVGLAVICRRTAWRLLPRRRSRWLLNETGDAGFDRLSIEYNGVMADRTQADAVVAACLDAATTMMAPSDRLVLSGVEADTAAAARRAAARAGLPVELGRSEPARWIDLSGATRGGYRSTLGRNTRQALSRTLRLYSERGPVEHRVMETPREALAAFREMEVLHQRRWGRVGAFTRPAFGSFHADLVARGVETGVVRISRITAGPQTIGILHNFVHDKIVLNYQSGFLYEDDNRLKPGIVSHVLAVEDALARGERGYDFMAGAAGHKNRLANAERPLHWLVVGRPTVETRIEAAIASAVRKVADWRRGGPVRTTDGNADERT